MTRYYTFVIRVYGLIRSGLHILEHLITVRVVKDRLSTYTAHSMLQSRRSSLIRSLLQSQVNSTAQYSLQSGIVDRMLYTYAGYEDYVNQGLRNKPSATLVRK